MDASKNAKSVIVIGVLVRVPAPKNPSAVRPRHKTAFWDRVQKPFLGNTCEDSESIGQRGVMLRFALLVTNDPIRTRWEIHISDCPDVMRLVGRGAFAQFLCASSAESIKRKELGISNGDGRQTTDVVIMPCCKTHRRKKLE
jgi:hypothetical protein